jgi:hypothetical protein
VSRPSHLGDALASLDIQLTGEEAAGLEAPYTPRYDFHGVSDHAELARISARLGIRPPAPDLRSRRGALGLLRPRSPSRPRAAAWTRA